MLLAVRSWLPSRQAVLFLLATLAPCLVLLTLGVQMIRQIEDARIAEDRQRSIDRVRQDLLTRLEAIKQQQLTAAAAHAERDIQQQDAVIFVGLLSGRGLELPWDNSSRAREFRESVNAGEFARRLRRADAEELIAPQTAAAVNEYRALIQTSPEPAQQNMARLSLAHALRVLGRRQESQTEYERILAAPPEIVDENDVPLAFYAIPPLLEAGVRTDLIRDWIRLAQDQRRLLPPASLYMARDFATRLGVSESEPALTALIQEREQAETLQREFPRLHLAAQGVAPVWAVYGQPAWLISATPPVGDLDGLLVAVRADNILGQVRISNGHLQTAAIADASGQSLGDSFPGLRIVLPPAVRPRQTFLIMTLALTIAFTLLAGYLLWRNVQRDLRLSEMRSQFVSSVSHELKTPLTAIRMFTETLRLDDDVDRQTRIEYLDTILHESERLSRLVDNVLDFGKIERGKKTYRLHPVRLDEVIEQAARTAQYPLGQAGFSLKVATQTDLPPVAADSDALQQAILNLLTNAMKYSGDSRLIGLSLDRQNGCARIQVVDHGIGIAPDDQQRIFDRFYRAPTAENQHIPGTGLGLTIVAHIAKAHGGNVHVESRPGSGSSFTITLPLEARA
jgi:signal transduction histidine kinase